MRVCPRCGTENPADANFCMRCGAGLTSTVGSEERKIITVVFCDLVGFTARAERMDPEDVKETLRAYHTVVKERIEHHGGTVEKFLGDGVIGIFGMPMAHEDDPERAVRASLRTLEAIEELDRARHLDLHVRIGVNTGEALVSTVPGEQIGGSIAGDVVNTGARLQAAAPTDAILVGDATHRATASVFVYEAYEPVTAKGKAEPLAVWRPVATRSRVEPGPRGDETPFIGRGWQLVALRAALDRAMGSAATPIVALVRGEAGVGKSRLVRELAGHVETLPRLIRWRPGRCLPYGDGVRFWPLGEIVKAEAGILDTDTPAEAGTKLDIAVEAVGIPPSDRPWIRALLEPLVGLPGPSPAPSQDERFAAWRTFIGAMAADRPAVLVVEDLQWADEALIAFLQSLASALAGVRVLVLAVGRTELEERFPGWSNDLPEVVRITLDPLPLEDARRLVRSLIGDAELPAETEAAVLERAGGNPRFAEEFVGMLRDRSPDGVIASRDIPIPASLQALVAARLDALPLDLKELVHDAAVVGRVFWPGAVAAVADRARDDVVARLPFLLRRELISRDATSSIEGEPEFSFRHDVMVDVAYEQLPKAARIGKHRRAAAWIRSTVGARAADVAEEIAHHLERALELSPTPDEELRHEAADALLLAADRLDALDAAAAARAYERGLALLDPSAPGRADVVVRAAVAAEAVGRFELSDGWYREAIASYREQAAMLQLGETTGLLGRSLVIQGRAREAEEALSGAVDILGALPPGPELARVRSRIAGLAFVSGDYDRALVWAERTLADATDDEPRDAVAFALQYRGSVRAERGEPEGMDDLREAIRIAREHDLTDILGVGLGNLAYLTWFRNGPAAALDIAREIQTMARARGFTVTEMWGKAAEIESRFDLGEWDRVLQLAGELVAWDAMHGPSQIGMWGRFAQAWVHVRRGEVDMARADLAEVERSPDLLGFAEFQATAAAIGVVLAQDGGDEAEVLSRVRAFIDATRDIPEVRIHLLPVVVRAAVAAGHVDTAAALVPEGVVPPVERRRLSYDTACAVIEEAQGQADIAASAYAALAEGWDEFGFPLEAGQCRLGQARCLRTLGRDHEARPLLEDARMLLAPLGAAPLLAEIEGLLESPAYAADSIDAS